MRRRLPIMMLPAGLFFFVSTSAGGNCPELENPSGQSNTLAAVAAPVEAAYTIAVIPPPASTGLSADDVKQRMDAAVVQIPPCILNAGEAGPIQFVVGSDPGRTNAAYYRPVRQNGQWTAPRVVMGLGHFVPSYHSDMAHIHCTDAQTMRRLVGDPVGYTALHESLHHLHRAGNPAAVDDFLSKRYNSAVRAYENHRFARLYNMQPQTMGELGRARSQPSDQAEACRVHGQLDQAWVSAKMPSRYPNDRHAADSGSEYFAISVQQYLVDPEGFCDTLNDAERESLKENFGDCIDQIPRTTPMPSCW